jgi:pimeloyl-ACP methyl ester carboxylesterase
MASTQPDNHIERPDWLPETLWPHRIRTASIRGSSIAYTDEGSGPTLLLISDGMCSYIWGQLIEHLIPHFRVVTLDFPGSGLSPSSHPATTLATDSHLLEAFVDGLGLDRFTPVVHDLGGGVGLGVAGRRPDSIDGLVLINTFAWPPEGPGLRTMLRLMGSRPMSTLNSATNLVARASSGRFGIGRHLAGSERAAFVAMFRHQESRRRFHTLMRAAVDDGDYLATVEAGLEGLSRKPAMTVFGQRNDPFGFQEKWVQHFPGAEQMVIPGGYHFPMCDDPVGVAAAITSWHQAKVANSIP